MSKITDDPVVAAIIPAYNRAEYLNQAIESVLNQDYKKINLIVVDDGSDDGSFEIAQSYGSKLTLLSHDNRNNKGQSACINLALKHSLDSSDFIAILDSDDYWEPNKISVQIEVMENQPDIGLVYGNGRGVDANGNCLYDIYGDDHIEENDPNRVLLDCYFSLPTNSLVRSGVLQQAGLFDEKLKSAQDHDMAIRIAEITRLAYIDVPVFNYRRHENTISSTNADLRWRNGFYILDRAAKRYPYVPSTLRKRAAVLHFRLFQIYREKNSWLAAFGHLLLAGIKDPGRSLEILKGSEKISSPH